MKSRRDLEEGKGVGKLVFLQSAKAFRIFFCVSKGKGGKEGIFLRVCMRQKERWMILDQLVYVVNPNPFWNDNCERIGIRFHLEPSSQ